MSTTLAEGNARLLRLAEFLEQLEPKRFDYKSWVGSDWGGKSDLSCGTTACALGWAAAMPEFQALGVRLVKSQYSQYNNSMIKMENSDYFPGYAQIQEVGIEIFGLDRDEFEYLFVPREDWDPHGTIKERTASAKQVAAKIREFVLSGRRASVIAQLECRVNERRHRDENG